MSETASAPTVIGSYRLLGRLGEGGMGVVHLAEDDAGSKVALKLLRPHVVADDEGRSRLAREVTSLRRVRSPLVAEVIDADPWGELPYVVTRYVAGPSLHDLVRTTGPLAESELTALASGLAEAVEAVHQAGVLHRDVKPSNVLIENRSPVLIDFGLARLVDDSRLTISGWLLGTPGYLAPEILHGAEPTTAADMHAWAATLVFAASGRPPYGTGPPVAVMDRIRRAEYDLTGVPAHLLGIVQAALASDPRSRPSAAEAQSWLADPVQDRRTTLVPVYPPRETSSSGSSLTRPLTVAGSSPYAQPVAGSSPYAPVSRRGALVGRLLRTLTYLSMLSFLVAATLAAPVLTAVALVLLLLLTGTASWVIEAVEDRRYRRGRRSRSDPWWASVLSPWYVLVAFPGALLLSTFVIGAGAGAATGLAAFTSSGWRWPALVGGALAAGVVAWWGPLARRPRGVVRRLVHFTATAYRALAWLMPLLLLVAAAALALVWQVAGTAWWPLPGPPRVFELPPYLSP